MVVIKLYYGLVGLRYKKLSIRPIGLESILPTKEDSPCANKADPGLMVYSFIYFDFYWSEMNKSQFEILVRPDISCKNVYGTSNNEQNTMTCAAWWCSG